MLMTSLSVLLCISSILFQDDFNDGNADGWFTVGTADYTVEDNKYHFTAGTGIYQAISYRGETGETMSIADYCVTVDIEPNVGLFHGLSVRYSEDAQFNLMLVLCPQEQTLHILRYSFYSLIAIDTYEMPIQAESTYRLKFQCDGTIFSGKAWDVEESEPEEWLVSTPYPPITDNGSVALFAFAYSKSPLTITLSSFFDNVVAEESIPYALTQSSWAAIKATF